MKGILIRNLPSSTKLGQIISTFGLDATEYTKFFCQCKMGHDPNEGNKKFAFITAPSRIAEEIRKLNGIEICSHTIEFTDLPLEFLEVHMEMPNPSSSESKERSTESHVLQFLVPGTQNQSLCNSTIISEQPATNKTKVHMVIATGLQFSKIDSQLQDIMKKIDEDTYLKLIAHRYETVKAVNVVGQLIEVQNSKSELATINLDNSLTNPSSITELTKIIKGYNMNVCKQMKKKLLFTERPYFNVRLDKGSTSREQVYVELSTANYEYLKHNLIGILKTKLNCTEDMGKRRIAKDLQESSEVEAQFSIQFSQNEVKYNVHVTFYYTRCSIWIQGSSAKINNLTAAQYFTMHYIEKVSNMVVKTVPLDSVTEVLRERITSFLSPDEAKSLAGNNKQIEEGRCVSCSRKCSDNNKSIECNLCSMKQHFYCAGIKVETERNMYLSGSMPFTCNNCFAEGGVMLDDTSSYPTDFEGLLPGELVSPAVVESSINKTTEDTNRQLHIPAQILKENERNDLVAQIESTNETNYSTEPIIGEVSAATGSNSSNNNCPVSQIREDSRNDQANHDRITIRRLQNEISQLKSDHLKSKEKYEGEINTLKESLRQSIAECEKEKETRATLQHCVDAFRAANNGRNSSAVNTTNAGTPMPNGINKNNTRNVRKCWYDDKQGGCKKADCTFHHDNPRSSQLNPSAYPRSTLSQNSSQTITRRCRFYNRVGGCKNGSSCTFLHIQRPLCRKHPNCNNPRCTFFHPANFQMAKRPREPPDADQTTQSAGMDQSMVNQVRSSPAQNYQETQYMSNPNLATRYKNWGNETSNQAMDQNNFVQDHQPNKNFPQQWNQQQNRCPPSQPQPLMDMKPRFRSQQTPNVQYYAQPDSAMMQNSTMGMVQSPNVQPQYTSSQPLMMQNPSVNMHQTPRFHQHPQHPHQRMMEQSPTATMLQFPNHQQYMKYQIETSPPSHPMFQGGPHQTTQHQLNRVMV